MGQNNPVPPITPGRLGGVDDLPGRGRFSFSRQHPTTPAGVVVRFGSVAAVAGSVAGSVRFGGGGGGGGDTHARIHTCTHTRIHAYTCTYTHTRIHAYTTRGNGGSVMVVIWAILGNIKIGA